jgi:hypothetical protein
MEALNGSLRSWNAIGPTSFPDPERQRNRYEVGEPHQVWFTVWSLVFICRQCGMVHYYLDIGRLLTVNERLRCMRCKQPDILKQVPFAYVCECGRIETVFIPKHVPGHTIRLIDKGGFQESSWFCEECRVHLRKDARAGLGFRRCECGPKKFKRGIRLDDSGIYYSQTLSLVDIEPQALDRWKENVRFSDLLLGAVLRIPSYQPSHILDLARWKPASADLSPEMKAMKAMLIQGGKSEAAADAMVRKAAQQAGADPYVVYDAELEPYRSGACARDWKSVRRTVEYVFVRDEPSSAGIALDALIEDAQRNSDTTTVERLTEQKRIAAELGLVRLQVVQALPILLAGIGYSRRFAGPQPVGDGDQAKVASLRAFPTQNGKIPIYVARNTTEALLYEIDPWRMAAFLSLNGVETISPAATSSEQAIRAWLLEQCVPLIERGESHLTLMNYEQEHGISVHEPSALVFGVIHTLSHVLKATAYRYVGIDGDALSEYLFPAHLSGLLYVSTHVEFTLGGIDSVFRSNMTQWLGSARDYAGRCSFDPVCSTSGGACLACLYPKFGCAHFNRTVSRAFLFGGKVSGRPGLVTGFWSPAVALKADQLRGKQASL